LLRWESASRRVVCAPLFLTGLVKGRGRGRGVKLRLNRYYILRGSRYSRIHPTGERTRLRKRKKTGIFPVNQREAGIKILLHTVKTAFTLFSHCNFPLRAKTLNPNGVRISVVAPTNGRPAHMNTALANPTGQLSWPLISGVFERPRRSRCFPIKNQVKNTFHCAFCP